MILIWPVFSGHNPSACFTAAADGSGVVVRPGTGLPSPGTGYPIGGQSYNLQYGYNLAGQLTSEKYLSGMVVNMTVDNFGRLSTVSDTSRTYLNGVGFNTQGLLSQMNMGNGTNQTFGYNDRFQMTSQSLQRGAEVLQKYDYSYGTTDLASGTVDATKNNGQLGKIEGFIGANKQWSQRFGYDELGRLSEAREYKAGVNTRLGFDDSLFDGQLVVVEVVPKSFPSSSKVPYRASAAGG